MRARLIFFCVMVATLVGHTSSHADEPRNIIMMVGDGMATAQITAGRTIKGSLALDEFKTIGLVTTHAYGDDYITDSAASATAMATGVLSYNGAIGVGPDTTAHKTVLEFAQEQGRKTGLIAVCSITHATPACYVAHVPSRRMNVEIAEQISRSGADVLLGSGWGYFLPNAAGGQRNDGKNLIEAMQQQGYAYASTPAEFAALDFSRVDRVLGLFAEKHCGKAQDRDPSLKAMTTGALEYFSRFDSGFFLVVEGSQIDWAGHDNDAGQVPIEMVDFDDTIAAVIEFARKRGDTLVLVTGDHETGGYAIVDGSLQERRVEGRFSTNRHTATMLPLYAMGPGAERFAGTYSNTEIGKRIFELMGK